MNGGGGYGGGGRRGGRGRGGLNFYKGNIFHDFDKETPAKGYFLIGENEMEKVLSTYGDKYTFRTLTKSDQTFSELKQKIVLSEFELK